MARWATSRAGLSRPERTKEPQMKMPVNNFKRALAERRLQIGLWMGLADPICAEICAGAGFDWLVIDAEHAPNHVRTILSQLQATAPYPVEPVVRATIGDVAHIKQLLDLGGQTLLVPVVETGEQAALLVRATRYPPDGIRGVGSALARASRWSRIGTYLKEADDQICLVLQVETARGLENIDAIASTAGVDGVFIGPADLSAALGHRGDPEHPVVQAAIEQSVARILAAGKAAGILVGTEALARKYIALGCSFVAEGVDTILLARATQTLAEKFKGAAGFAAPSASGAY
jgi:4-hydroxy-2-oxoheptanedioate aldolase